MSAVAVRRTVVAVCVAGIAGMIVSSIADSTGAALTFGLVTATAVLCLIVATAVTRGTPAGGDPSDPSVEERAERLEEAILRLVDKGADEPEVRSLVREAVALGRALR